MAKPLVLLTGASGQLGRWLAPELAGRGYRLRLSDIADAPDALPPGAEFVAMDLADRDAVLAAAAGATTILHFGGISTEQPWDRIIGPNIQGVVHVFEAARAHGQRVIMASSNHTIGFYPRGQQISTEDPMRPDGYYGLSKAFAELLGQMMWDKHGVESVHLRIGSAEPAPREARHLSTWMSRPDLLAAVIAAIEAPRTGCARVWGVSDNAARWWQGDDAARIGFVARDSADAHAPLPDPGDARARRFQGGSFAAQDYSRGSDDAGT